MWGINVFIMQIDYVKISCKKDVHICRTNFSKEMEQNLHETTSQWEMYRKFSKDLEVQDDFILSRKAKVSKGYLSFSKDRTLS
jgi:hypothetical protein